MGFFVVKKIESMEFDEEFDAWVGIKNQKGELVCLDCMTGVGTPGGSIRSGPKETKMKEDMIRSYVRKRYGIVGDDWEVGEV